MAPPDRSGEVRVAVDALHHDAERWERAAQDLRAAADSARAQVTGSGAFSFVGGDAAATYDGLRAKTADLLAQGARNCADIATALRTSAQRYAAEEAAGVHRMRGVY